MKKAFLFAVLSGIMLGVSWFPPFTPMIFISWIPLLYAVHRIHNADLKRKAGKIFLLSYSTFLIWNVITTWWTWYASPGGGVAAILANSLLMSISFLFFSFLFSKLESISHYKLFQSPYWLLIPVWISFEYLHSEWELAWTWLSLGNVLAYIHPCIQWYAFTGTAGGTLWILSINIIIFNFLIEMSKKSRDRKRKKYLLFLVITIIFPIAISLFIFYEEPLHKEKSSKDKKDTMRTLVVQPNIDPYNEKFIVSYESQLQSTWQSFKNKLNSSTDVVLLPETFLTENIWENDLQNSYSIAFIRDTILKKFPQLALISGANTFYNFNKNETPSPTAHPFSDGKGSYDIFNTAIQVNNSSVIQLYHKSKLVPAVERMPYPSLLKPLEKLTINLGGTFGSLGTQSERSLFYNEDSSIRIAPVICYESLFGNFVNEYVRKGANVIFILTNDGWWSDSPGKFQHLNYARLRAIETGRWVARSANTGVSCIIDPKGNFSQTLPSWESGCLTSSIPLTSDRTIFSCLGDVTSIISSCLTAFLVLAILITILKRKLHK